MNPEDLLREFRLLREELEATREETKRLRESLEKLYVQMPKEPARDAAAALVDALVKKVAGGKKR